MNDSTRDIPPRAQAGAETTALLLELALPARLNPAATSVLDLTISQHDDIIRLIDAWTDEQHEAARRWASSVHLIASDNAIEAPTKPPHVAQLEADLGVGDEADGGGWTPPEGHCLSCGEERAKTGCDDWCEQNDCAAGGEL